MTKPETERIETIRKQYKMAPVKRGFKDLSKNTKNAVSDAV